MVRKNGEGGYRRVVICMVSCMWIESGHYERGVERGGKKEWVRWARKGGDMHGSIEGC